MRIAIGSLMQETNTFVPFKTDVDTFRSVYLRRGDELLTGYGEARMEIPGFLSVLRTHNTEIVPLLAAAANANGPVTRAAFDTLAGEMVDRLKAAGPVDGVLLALHGAMVIEDEPDAEGELLERVRTALPARTPIGVSLDLHGHLTPRMLTPNTFLVGYREYPHIDQFETGERVASLLCDVLAGLRPMPAMAIAKRPMVVSPVNARTTERPLSGIVAAAREMETQGRVLHAGLFPVQPWLDIPDLGFGVLVCADDPSVAQRAANQLADMAWAARDDFVPDLLPLEEAIRIGLTSEGTTVVGDVGDAPSGGTAADNAGVLRALLAAGANRNGRPVYLTLCDPDAVRRAAEAGVGATVRLPVGHKTSRDGEPVTVTGTVRVLTDGKFTHADAGAKGNEVDLGLCAVLAIGDIRLALRSLPAYEWDTGIFTSVGLPIEQAALIFVKSPAHYRVSYAPRAARVLAADTPGATCGNMRKLTFSRVTRPLYPLDAA
ncbi:MAG TPA: M81 family metallopeptidase [Acetobacteraceae bacterium]|jgi:microcystin degradation protein MlrC|nr:M81 family metallopeptidase [Acetobacteraceae bacterium]